MYALHDSDSYHLANKFIQNFDVTENFETKCTSNNIRRFKVPVLHSNDFPSRVSLVTENVSVAGEREDSIEDKKENSSKVIEPLAYWRRTENADEEEVTKLIQCFGFSGDKLFREPNVPCLIEKSVFSIVQYNAKDQLVSFTSTFSYPNIPAISSFDWYNWMENTYRLKDVTALNSLFIHYMVWNTEYTYEFLETTLKTLFLEYPFLNNIIITKPPKVKIPNIFSEFFIEVLPRDAKTFDWDCSSVQTMLVCLRHSVLERLKIRLALPEDHDDLMPIVDKQIQSLRKLYGDFCIAEIIEFPGTEDRKTIVCEFNGYAVGFMTVNRAVDIELLNSQFDLSLFNGLKKPHEEDKLTVNIEEDEEESEVHLPEKADPNLKVIESETMLKFLNWRPSLCVSDEDVYSNEMLEPFTGYNELSNSVGDLVRDTLKLVPKFSAYALSSMENFRYSTSIPEPSIYRSTFDDVLLGEESTVQSELSLISLQYYNLPIFKGAQNAFCIEFFAMHDEIDERFSHDILEAAFELFPDLEYCILTIPSESAVLPVMSLFTRVTPRPLKRFKQELYVCHRSCIMISFMTVKRVTKSDLDEIYTLLNGIKKKEFIYADAANSCFYEDSGFQAFVLLISKSIAGLAVICKEYDMEYLAQHYQVSNFLNFDLNKTDCHAILKHLVLSPIFQPLARFFLRDLMRVADVSSLYFPHYDSTEGDWNTSSLITVLEQLIPVRPRQMVKYHRPSLEPNIPPDYLLHKYTPFSLFHTNPRLSGFKKLTSNFKLVVVGSSQTAFSFLEALFFGPTSAYVTYNNVTWVSPHGMGTELPSHTVTDLMFPLIGKYTRYYKKQLCLNAFVNFVYGVMTHINRVDKYITINNDAILWYDYLVLLCGTQYLVPEPYVLTNTEKVCRRNFRPRCSLFKYLITQQPESGQDKELLYPPNVFLINTTVDATNALISLQYLFQKRQGFSQNEKIIVYGNNLATYFCVEALLKFGIPPTMIALVEPFFKKSRSFSCFRDEKVEVAVVETLRKLNIELYKDYILYDWELSDNQQVQKAVFHSHNRRVIIHCLAMFPFDRKVVSDVTFQAINEASLVYDGKLVINTSFQTNDKHIYAAGSLTKYKRRYYAKDKKHEYYSASEVGEILADIIRKKIDPTVRTGDSVEPPPDTPPQMKQPITIYGLLPDGWKYFMVTKPGILPDLETKATVREFGDILTTGDCNMTQGYGYFKLSLDDGGFVDGILCYTKDAIDIGNLSMLYGKHEKLLNDLIFRFDLGMIHDFYSYFREPWAYALFHDQFKNVYCINKDIVKENKKKTSFVDNVINTLKANNWQRPSKAKLNEIIGKFEISDFKDEISQNLLDFLYYFDEAFPMYATPRILRVLLQDASFSVLHKEASSREFSGNKSSVKITNFL